ncbi:E3 ubiquitin-protein ligase listerin [Silene latifolia]|uniref:E3 ubiquitin-protein ligase listerin n=1 Tax=Silene latifolia TaxID=37657 RepID=UPI003D77A036
MGKQKGESGRTKARASSSSLAASLVPVGTPQIGFGGYLGSTRVDSALHAEESGSFKGVDGEMVQYLKRLARRDPTTKLKALNSLAALLKDKSGKDVVLIIPQWGFEYRRLLMDYNREVRRATHETMTSLVTAAGRELAVHLKSLMGPWWFGQFDSVSEVSVAAKRSLQVAFPSHEKRLDALMFCTSEVFEYLGDNLKLTPQSMADLAVASDELTEMHQRVISSSLLALATLIDVLLGLKSAKVSSDESNNLPKNALKAQDVAISSAKSLMSAHRNFQDFLKSHDSVVRTATYTVLRSFVKNIPEVIGEEDVKALSPAILGALQEKDPSCHTALWETILFFCKRFPQSWSSINFQKTFSNRFWQFLRNGCFGSQLVSYPAFVLLLDALPPEIVGLQFFIDFFQNLWAGRDASHPSSADRLAFFLTLKECFLWVLNNASRYCKQEDVSSFRFSLLDNIIVKLLWHNFLSDSETRHGEIVESGKNDDAFSEIPKLLDSHLFEIRQGHLHDTGECIINILSGIYPLDCQLLVLFCEAFQENCLKALQQTVHADETSYNLMQINRFIVMVGKYAISKSESWPLEFLAGPLLEKTLSLIISADSADAVNFLLVMVSIFGPKKTIQKIISSEETASGIGADVTDGVNREPNKFLNAFERTFVHWCFMGNESLVDSRMNVLLALLDEECFTEQWDTIISYAAIAGTSHVGRLATLIQKVRSLTRQRSRVHNNKIFQISCWQHEKLDSVAFSVMLSAPESLDSHVKFIRAVLGGSMEDDDVSFLSKNATVHVYERAFDELVAFIMESPFACVRKFGSLSRSLVNSSTSEIKHNVDVGHLAKRAYFALEVLSSSTFTLKSYCKESELLLGAAGVMFVIDWDCCLSQLLGTELKNCSQDHMMAREKFGRAMHEFRTSIDKQFWRSFPAQFRAKLGSLLVQFNRSSIFVDDTFDTSVVTSLCCKWIVEVCECLCVSQLEEQNLIDKLLGSDDLWPLWIMPANSTNKEKITLRLEHAPTDVPVFRTHEFVALIDKLILEIGVAKMFVAFNPHPTATEEGQSENYELAASQSKSFRAWLVAEMFCTWKWPGGSALGTLLPSLISYVKSEQGGESSFVFDSVLNILLKGALICGINGQLRFFNTCPPSNKDLDEIEEPFLRALVSLLATLLNEGIWNQEQAIEFWQLLISDLYTGQETNINCLRILPLLVPVLAQFLHESGGSKDMVIDSLPISFREDVQDWLGKTLAFPSLISWTSDEDIKEWFHLALSCFPLRRTEDMHQLKLHPSSLETKHLLDLFRKQRHDASLSIVSNSLPVVPVLLSRLMVIVVGYCWKELDEEEWRYILSHWRSWTELVVTTMEEAAESLDIENGDNLEVTVSKVEQLMHNLDSSLVNIAINALYGFSYLMELSKCHPSDQTESLTFCTSEVCQFTIDQIQEGVLRIFFSAGISEAISDLLSCEGLSIISRSHATCPQFWNLVARTVINSSMSSREKAFKAVELWGLKTNVISSLMSILFSSKLVSTVQFASFVLLSSAPLSSSAIMKENVLDSLPGTSTSVSVSDNLDLLAESNLLRDEIHRLLCTSPAEILDQDLEAQERVQVFLAWSLVLTYLASLPASSSKREKLVQEIQESASSAILDCLFQHIPFELAVTNGMKKKDSDLPAELEDIATAATRAIRTGSVLFVVECLWPVRPQSLSLLASAIFGLMLHVLPAFVRVWFTSLRVRSASSAIESFTKTWCSPHLVSDELSQIKKSDFVDECFSVSVSKSANEVVATYTKEETGMDLVIRLPVSYPLRPVDVECTRSLGISEVKQRKWLLSLMAFVQNKNGALAEAIRIWKSNFDKEFEGVEECPICYSVIHTSNHSLPRLACKTCKHKFHAACLYKWFSTSHKSNCPLCQSPF